MLDTGALDRGQSINSFMHACKLHTPSIKQLSETHLHNIMSNHINASALISQPAAAFWNSYREIGRNVLVVATLFAAVCVEFMADRAQTVSSQRPIRTGNSGPKTSFPMNKSDLSCSEGDLSGQWSRSRARIKSHAEAVCGC